MYTKQTWIISALGVIISIFGIGLIGYLNYSIFTYLFCTTIFSIVAMLVSSAGMYCTDGTVWGYAREIKFIRKRWLGYLLMIVFVSIMYYYPYKVGVSLGTS